MPVNDVKQALKLLHDHFFDRCEEQVNPLLRAKHGGTKQPIFIVDDRGRTRKPRLVGGVKGRN
jgi:hypothetical protein